MVYYKLILDTRRLKTDGLYPIFVRITYNKTNTTITTGVRVRNEHWDANRTKEAELLRYNDRSLVTLEAIENVLMSNKGSLLEKTLALFGYSVQFTKDQKKTMLKCNRPNLKFVELIDEKKEKRNYRRSKDRYGTGILPFDNKEFIRRKNLLPEDIAKFSDANYTSLPEIDVFNFYYPPLITAKLKDIFRNSLIGKSRGINSFHSLYYHPGNLLKLIRTYSTLSDFEHACKSFESFVKLSSFNFHLSGNELKNTAGKSIKA